MTTDPDVLLAGLEERDREAIERWSRRILGDPDAWVHVTAFRGLVEVLGVLTVAGGLRREDPDLSERQAWLAAGELVLGSDSERDTCPADIAGRRLRRWLERARTKCPLTDSADLVGSGRKEPCE